MRIFIYPQPGVIGFLTWVPGRPLSLVTQINILQSHMGTCELRLSPGHPALHSTGPSSVCHHSPAPMVPEHSGALFLIQCIRFQLKKPKQKKKKNQLCQQSTQFLLWENLPSGNAIIWAKHCNSKLSQTGLCALHLHHKACGVSRVTVPLKQAQGIPSIMLSPHLGARPQGRTSIIPQSLSAIPRLLTVFLLAMLWHWLLSFPQWKEQLQTLAFVTPRNTAVGWEAPPGKKAPAMSFLAYYKKVKYIKQRTLIITETC